AEVLHADIRDVDDPHEILKYDMIVVAFGWHVGFEGTVRRYVEKHLNPGGIVLVASTVPVGTCWPWGWNHLLVRGRHPYMADSFRVGKLQVSGPRAGEVVDLFSECDLHAWNESDDPTTTEVAKLGALATFSVSIMAMYKTKELCDL